jgi:hypothetical protein
MVVYRAVSQRRNLRHGPLVARQPHAGLQGARALTVEVDGVVRGKVKAGKAVARRVGPGPALGAGDDRPPVERRVDVRDGCRWHDRL